MRKAKTNHKYPVYMTKGELHALHNGMTLHPDFKKALDAINKAHRAIVKDEEKRRATALNREAYQAAMRSPVKQCRKCGTYIPDADTVCPNCEGFV